MLHEPTPLLVDDLLVDYAIIDENVVSLYVLALKLVNVIFDLCRDSLNVRNIKRVYILNCRLYRSLHLLQSVVYLRFLPTFLAVSESAHNNQYKSLDLTSHYSIIPFTSIYATLIFFYKAYTLLSSS